MYLSDKIRFDKIMVTAIVKGKLGMARHQYTIFFDSGSQQDT